MEKQPNTKKPVTSGKKTGKENVAAAGKKAGKENAAVAGKKAGKMPPEKQNHLKKTTSPAKELNSQPISRLFKVMECMASYRIPTRLIDLAKKLDMSQSTVYRYVQTLCHLGYAYFDEQAGCYALTWKICEISSHIKTNLSLRSIANPFLNQLALAVNTNVCLVVREGMRTTYLDYVDSPKQRDAVPIRIGHNAPIYSSSSGKVLLTALPRNEVSHIIDSIGLIALTPKTITVPDKLFAELQEIQAQGYAIDDEECELGRRCISVPLYDYNGNIVAAVSLSANAERMTVEYMTKELLPILRETAGNISYRLGYKTEND